MHINEEDIRPGYSLEKMAMEGVFLYLENELSSPNEIYRACFNEKATYMPDFILDELGRVKELRYNKVSYM